MSDVVVDYPVTDDLCTAWAELTVEARQKGRVLHGADAWVAATALVLNAPLFTHNGRDFDYLDNLRVVSDSKP